MYSPGPIPRLHKNRCDDLSMYIYISRYMIAYNYVYNYNYIISYNYIYVFIYVLICVVIIHGDYKNVILVAMMTK